MWKINVSMYIGNARFLCLYLCCCFSWLRKTHPVESRTHILFDIFVLDLLRLNHPILKLYPKFFTATEQRGYNFTSRNASNEIRVIIKACHYFKCLLRKNHVYIHDYKRKILQAKVGQIILNTFKDS